MNKKRTSVSLPMETISIIKRHGTKGISHKHIALCCLRRFLNKQQIQDFEHKPTCSYNPENAQEIMTLWLTEEEHYNLKMYRLTLGTSVSYLLDMAIRLYLPYILKLFTRKLKETHLVITIKILDILQKQLEYIHRKVKVSYSEFTLLHIVMPRNNAKINLLKFRPRIFI